MILALDIGGTKLAAGVAEPTAFHATGHFDRVARRPTPRPGEPEEVIATMVEMARELLGESAPTAIGISIGGPLDHGRGLVINFPHLPGWRDIALCDRISRDLGAPSRLDNDANLGALAEHSFGAGRDVRDMVYVTISTGIGGGVIVGGELLHGVGSAAGEVGHIVVRPGGPVCSCGNRGCLEAVASGTAIARAATDALAGDGAAGALSRVARQRGITARDVFDAAAEGDAVAKAVLEVAFDGLALGLADIIHVLAPERIVLGGGVSRAGDALVGPLWKRLHHLVHYVPLERIELRTATCGADSALVGAGLIT